MRITILNVSSDEREQQDGGKTKGQGEAGTKQDPVSHFLSDGNFVHCLFFPRSTFVWELAVSLLYCLVFAAMFTVSIQWN